MEDVVIWGAVKNKLIPKQIITARMWDNRTAPSGEPPFSFLMKIKKMLNVNADAIARRLPSNDPMVNLSKNMITMPPIINITERICSLRIFSFKNTPLNTSVIAGAVYCKTIAFAAVVVLLAVTKSIIVHALAIAASTNDEDHLN